jgi:large conductance mechanosensitive channel
MDLLACLLLFCNMGDRIPPDVFSPDLSLKSKGKTTMFAEFRKFILRGNVIDLAVGVIMGVAFGAIVTSLVNDVIMPPIGLALGGVDFSELMIVLREGTVPPPYPTVAAAQEAGAVVIGYGQFLNTVIQFLITAFAVFLLVRAVNMMVERFRRKPEAEKEDAVPTSEEKLVSAIETLTATIERKL